MARYREGTVGAAFGAAAARLDTHGIDTARLDARVLMAHVLGKDQAWLIGHADETLDDLARQAFDALIGRRENHEPVAYLVGAREFWSLPFQVTPDTLIPRPDTETLVALALETLKDQPPARVLDFGTGSGCILLSLLSEWPASVGTGVDIAPESLAVARINADALNLADRVIFYAGDWQDALPVGTPRFDLIVANPPYITEAEMVELPADVGAFEPIRALAAGADGLDAYRRIAPATIDLLRPGGLFVAEIGMTQGDAVAGILSDAGLRVLGVHEDAGGRPRCVAAVTPDCE